MSKVNFRIVEGEDPEQEEVYQKFKEAYLNRLDTNLKVIREELGLSEANAASFRKRVNEETGLMRRGSGRGTILILAPNDVKSRKPDIDFEGIYDDFEKDFLRPDLSIQDLIQKYNLPTEYWCTKLRVMVRERTGWVRENKGRVLVNLETGERRRVWGV